MGSEISTDGGNALGPTDRDGDGKVDSYRTEGGWAQPIVIDIDKDGIEVLSGSDVRFDFDNGEGGFLESGSWVSKDDGFLVIDRQSETGATTANADGSFGDGNITRADELILSLLTSDTSDTDLQAVRNSWMNSNKTTVSFEGSDGVTRPIQVLDSRDAGWKHLRIWRDLDQDGEVDGGLNTGELFTLDAFGITQINLGYDDGSTFEDQNDDLTVGLSTLHGMASYVRNGETVEGGIGDMSLAYDERGWRRVAVSGGYEYQFETGESAASRTIC